MVAIQVTAEESSFNSIEISAYNANGAEITDESIEEASEVVKPSVKTVK